MPIKTPKITKKIIESLTKEQPRDRKRGKGKIKIVKRDHVTKEELEKELMDFKKTAICSERLGELFMDLVENLATKTNFSGYSFLEEMKSKAIFFLLKYSKNFNPNKISKRTKQKVSPFAYCTQIAINGFKQVIKKEKKIC